MNFETVKKIGVMWAVFFLITCPCLDAQHVVSVVPEPNTYTSASNTNLVINLDSALEPLTVTSETFMVYRNFRGAQAGAFTIGATSSSSIRTRIFYPVNWWNPP